MKQGEGAHLCGHENHINKINKLIAPGDTTEELIGEIRERTTFWCDLNEQYRSKSDGNQLSFAVQVMGVGIAHLESMHFQISGESLLSELCWPCVRDISFYSLSNSDLTTSRYYVGIARNEWRLSWHLQRKYIMTRGESRG